MAPQSSQTSEFKLPPHLHFGPESCPTCGQTIPPDKLAEISGRIAAKDHERKLAITAQLEKQYAIEKARADSQARADLEAERRKSASREMQAREEAKRAAESAAAARIQAIEAAQQRSVAALQARVDESDRVRTAAKKNEGALQLEVEKLRQANAKIKEDAAAEATRIRQIATEKAQLRFQDTLAEHEKAATKANAKLREAEKRASEAESSLHEQRQILEKAGDDAVNAEKARSFQDKQKLLTQVSDLKRALENKTNEELGEGAEIDLLEALKAEFKDDKIDPIRRGAPGADIRHLVMLRGQKCGTILYDSKNHKKWREEHAAKLRRDQLAEKADHAILSTHKFPRNAHQLHHRDGVLLANPARVVSVVTIIRQHMLQLHTLRVSKIERESKTAVLYEFITSSRCKQLLDRVDQRAGSLLDMQEQEIKWHKKNWENQGAVVRAIQKAKGDLACEIDSIIGTSADETEISEAS
jgi:hypothetical protein